MRPVRVGVVGLGTIGALHAKVFAGSARADLVAVADTDALRAREAGATLGVQAFGSVGEMLDEVELDAISLCTPDLAHEAPAVEILAAGTALLLEKPMAHDAAAAHRIAAEILRTGAKAQVNHLLRADPRYAAARERAGALGRVIHVSAARNVSRARAARLGTSTSILFYLGVHDIDAVQWIAGSPIAEVFARKVNLSGRANEDAVTVSLRLENGAIGTLQWSWAWPETLPAGFFQTFEIVGENGSVGIDSRGEGLSFVEPEGAGAQITTLWPELGGRVLGALAENLETFLIGVRDDRPFLQDWRDALSAVEVLDAIRASIDTCQPAPVMRRAPAG